MTIDKTLRRSGRLQRARNVLRREERIAHLEKQEAFPDGRSPFGLPKVRIIRQTIGKKKKKKAKEEDDTSE